MICSFLVAISDSEAPFPEWMFYVNFLQAVNLSVGNL